MGKKCSAFGCTSGYGSEKGRSVDQRFTMHSCPLKDKELCEKWIRANPRKDFQPTTNSGLCSLHVRESDFVEYSQDKNSSRQKQTGERLLCRRYLKKDAVPSVFPNAPAYFSTNPCEPRPTTKATSASRLEDERRQLATLETSFTAKDDISLRSLAEIRDKILNDAAFPGGFQLTILENNLLIYKMDVINEVACIRACITLRPNLEILVTLNGKGIPQSHYKDICPVPLDSFSQLLNLMALVKSWCDEKKKTSRKAILSLIEQYIVDYAETFEECDNERRQLDFLLEQLIPKSKYARHYSPPLVIFAYMIYACSPSAYLVLRDQNLLCLPSVSTLKKITRRLDTNTGINTAGYLKLRVSKMNQLQKTVVLIIDEIYIAKRVEYSAGGVHGLTEDCRAASTLLCFMVKSLADKYKDLVAIYPMSNLTAAKQFTCYKEVMDLLRTVSLHIVAISVDNASTNRKFFTDHLCEGNLKTHMYDPISQELILLIFDPVHDLKNVYNNFQSRKSFDCPPFSLSEGASEGCHPRFQHIVDFYNKEAAMALKTAYKLNSSVLEPKNIEKTSVRLAVSVFCESTRDALKSYSTEEGLSGWASTADFLTMVMKLRNVMNVKTLFKGVNYIEI